MNTQLTPGIKFKKGPISCDKCDVRMIQESWAKRIGPNEYELFDRYICPKCKIMKYEILSKIDKNTDETRAIIHEKNTPKPTVFPKIPKALRGQTREDDGEIDVQSLFDEKP